MKKILAVTLAMTMLLGTMSFAEIKVYDVDKATEMALENNIDLKLYDDRVKIAEKRLKQAVLKAEDYEKKVSGDSDTRVANAKIEHLEPMKKQHTLDQLKRSKVAQEESISSDVYNQYNQYLMVLDNIESKEENIEFLKKEYDLKVKEHELGLITDTVLLQYKNSVLMAENQLSSLLNDKKLKAMKFNQLLGRDLNEEFVMAKTEIEDVVYSVEDLDAIIEKAQAERDDVLALNEAMEQLKKEKWIVHGYSISTNSTEDTIQDTLNDLEESMVNKQKEIDRKHMDIEYKIRSDYNNLASSYDDVKLAKLDLELSKRHLEIAELKLNTGLINALELESKQEDYDKKQTALQHTLLNYNLAVKAFKDYIN